LIDGIQQIAIPAHDAERAIAFYRDTLGLKFLFAAPNMAFFECGGVRLYIDANKGAIEPGGYSRIYLRSDDIAGDVARLTKSGVKVHREPQIIARLPDRDVWLAWIHDSEDNLVGLMQEKQG
jgi:methylmalonyl-CoA/ethylmalonyl-CoA epimerase